MDRAMRMVLAGGLTLLLSGIAFLIYLGYLHSHPPIAVGGTVTVPEEITGPPLTIPSFSLVDQEGKPRDRSLLEGRVSVVWFMFTNCPLACPAMSVQMADLQRKLKASGVQFVAISFDPAHDTPDVLKAYGTKYDIDWSNWVYLTEPSGQPLQNIARSIYSNDLHQHLEETPANTLTLPGGGGTMANIEHSVNFFVVGPDGAVLDKGWYSSLHAEDLDLLRDRVVAALQYFREQKKLKD